MNDDEITKDPKKHKAMSSDSHDEKNPKKQKTVSSDTTQGFLGRELFSDLPVLLIGRILSYTVSTIWELAELRTWNRSFREKVVPWMLTNDGNVFLNATQDTDGKPFLSNLVYPDFKFIQFGPSQWDVWRPTRDLAGALRLFEGYKTTEIRVLQVNQEQRHQPAYESILNAYGRLPAGQDGEDGEVDEELIEQYKEIHDLVAHHIVRKTDIEELEAHVEEELVCFDAANYQFCPPIPPSREKLITLEESQILHEAESFHSIVTLKRDLNAPPGRDSHELQERLGSKFKILKAIPTPSEKGEEIKQIFSVPRIFNGWYYVGFLVDDDGNDNGETIRVAMTLKVGSNGECDGDYYLFDEMKNEENFDITNLKLDYLWEKYQSQPAHDGVVVMDGILSSSIQTTLVSGVQATRDAKQVAATERTGHQRTVWIDPELLCHEDDDTTETVAQIQETPSQFVGVPPLCLLNDKELDMRDNIWEQVRGRYGIEGYFDPDPPGVTRDFWGRKYDETQRHKMLPAYFEISKDGEIKITEDIADLTPRLRYPELYQGLEGIFRTALPLVESVYGYCRDVRKEVRTWEGYEYLRPQDCDMKFVPMFRSEGACSLRGQRLQVITTLEDFYIDENGLETDWTLVGRPHEEIVAALIYVIDCGGQANPGHIQFKRAYHKREATFVDGHLSGAQGRPVHKDELIRTALQPAGRATLREERYVVFPNTHLFKLNLNKTNQDIPVRLTLLRMDIVNPEKRILSTKEVSDKESQSTVEENLSRRNALRNLRSRTNLDMHVREIHLYTD